MHTMTPSIYQKHKRNREIVQWGSFGKDGNGPLTHRYIKDLSDNHLLNVLTHVRNNPMDFGHMRTHIIREITYRKLNNIQIKDYAVQRRNRRKMVKNTNS